MVSPLNSFQHPEKEASHLLPMASNSSPSVSMEANRSSAELGPGELGSMNQQISLYAKTLRISVIGSLNYDHIWIVPRLPRPSETLMIGEYRQTPGGKGAIQAIACARLSHAKPGGTAPFLLRSNSNKGPGGRRSSSQDLKPFSIKVIMIGVVGEDLQGARVMDTLAANRVDIEHILRCREETTGTASIALGKNGENNVLVHPGANYRLSSDRIHVDLPEGSPHLLILQMEIPVQTVGDLVKKAAEKRIPVLLNAAPVVDDFPLDILCSVEHLIVNKLEAEALVERRQMASNMSRQRPEQDENREAEVGRGKELCKSLLEFGMKYVVVTMGGHGGVVGSRGPDGKAHIFDYDAVEVQNVVDTTGCGGVFIGAYAVQYIRQKFSPGGGFDIARAVTWASKAAAMKARSFGSLEGVPWEDELDAA